MTVHAGHIRGVAVQQVRDFLRAALSFADQHRSLPESLELDHVEAGEIPSHPSQLAKVLCMSRNHSTRFSCPWYHSRLDGIPNSVARATAARGTRDHRHIHRASRKVAFVAR